MRYLAAYNSNHNLSVWLPELQGGRPGVHPGTFVFDGPAFLYEYTDGTANLTGSIYASLDTSKKFDVDVWFYASGPGVSPKKELSGSAYSPSGPVDTNDWWYYEIDNSMSTLTGVPGSTYDGWTLNLAEYSSTYSAQFGVGANGKNTNMGMAAWFGYTGTRSSSSHADFNLDLKPLQRVSPNNLRIPEPATMSLLSLGLVGFGMGALKRKKA